MLLCLLFWLVGLVEFGGVEYGVASSRNSVAIEDPELDEAVFNSFVATGACNAVAMILHQLQQDREQQ